MHHNEISPGGGFQPNRYTVSQIEKERELDAKREKLLKEFAEIDTSGD
jgi:hypothetical protein